MTLRGALIHHQGKKPQRFGRGRVYSHTRDCMPHAKRIESSEAAIVIRTPVILHLTPYFRVSAFNYRTVSKYEHRPSKKTARLEKLTMNFQSWSDKALFDWFNSAQVVGILAAILTVLSLVVILQIGKDM